MAPKDKIYRLPTRGNAPLVPWCLCRQSPPCPLISNSVALYVLSGQSAMHCTTGETEDEYMQRYSGCGWKELLNWIECAFYLIIGFCPTVLCDVQM